MSRFLARTGVRVYGSTRGSTRGPRGPKKFKSVLVCVDTFPFPVVVRDFASA